MKVKKGFAMGLFAITFGAAAIALSFSQINLGMYSPDDLSISPRAFPQFVAVLMMSFGLANIIRSLVFKKDETIVFEFKKESKIFFVFIALIVYVALFEWIGFIFSTILLASFVLRMQGSKKWQYYGIVATTTIFVFVAFKYGLNVNKLPWGYPLIWIFG